MILFGQIVVVFDLILSNEVRYSLLNNGSV